MSLSSLQHAKNVWFYLGLYAFLSLIFVLTVRTGDDFQRIVKFRELSQADDGLLSSFSLFYETVNGRVLGNALHFFLVDLPWQSSMIQALITLGIIWAVARLTRLTYRPAILLLALVVLSPSVFVFKQVTVWAAGYFNYVPPVLCILLTVLLVRDVRKPWAYVVSAALVVSACLFSENVTVAVVISSLVALCVALVVRKLRAAFAGIVLAAGVGAFVMFSSPVYQRISDGEDAYRQVGGAGNEGGVISLLRRVLENAGPLAEYGALDLAPIYLVSAIAIAIALHVWRAPFKVLFPTVVMLVGAFLLYSLSQFQFTGLDGRNRELADTLTLLILVLVLGAMSVALWLSKDAKAQEGAAWVAGGGLLFMPFLIVSPFGPRNMYFTVICLLVATLMVTTPAINRWSKSPNLAKVLAAVFGSLALLMVSLLGINKVVELRNLEAMKGVTQNETHLVLQDFPVSAIVQDPYNSDKQRKLIEQCRGTDFPCADLEIFWE